MNIKFAEILNAIPALNDLFTQKLKAKMAYKVAKNIKNLQEELDIFNKQRELIFTPVDREDDLSEDEKEELKKKRLDEIEALLQTDADVKIYTISQDEFERGGVTISPESILQIAFMLEDFEDGGD